MIPLAPGAGTSRLLRQLNLSPASVAKAAVWRGLRRPWMRWRHAQARRGDANAAAPPLRPRLQWACALLDGALPPPPEAAAQMMRSPAVLFGRCWNRPPEVLAGIDPRFGVEAWRLQHLQALAALHWQAQADPTRAAELAATLPEPLDRFLHRSIRIAAGPASAGAASLAGVSLYPMDHALRAISLLIAYTALQAPDELAAAVGAAVGDAVDACLSDPEYTGSLSNNHHLTNVACLLVMLASMRSAEGASPHTGARPGEVVPQRHRPPEPRFDRAKRWLLRALEVQFDRDGAHFECSSGYHMCALELLTLAALAVLDMEAPASAASATPASPSEARPPGAGSPQARWRILAATCPQLAGTLARACVFAQALIRPDASFPLIGDFDASRILRTCADYLPIAPSGEPPGATTGCDRFIAAGAGTRDGIDGLEARAIERTNADAAVMLARRLLALPGHFPRPPLQPTPQPVRRLSTEAPAGCASTRLDDDDLRLVGMLLGPRSEQLRSGVRYRFAVGTAPRWQRITLFEHAGLAVGRGESFLVTLRSGLTGQMGLGTHSHLDHLACDIWIDGGVCIADPGSWCYGASPALRNRYRGNSAHFTPLWQVDWSQSLRHPFCIERPPSPATLGVAADSFWALLRLGQGWVSRIVTLRDAHLVVIDSSSHLDLEAWPMDRQLPLADGYFGPLVPDHRRPDRSRHAVRAARHGGKSGADRPGFGTAGRSREPQQQS